MNQFSIYPGVSFSVAAMANTLDYPVTQVSPNKLRIACNQIKRQITLRQIKFSHEIQQTFSDAYALIIGQDYKTANAIIVCQHMHVCNCNKGNRLLLIKCNIAFDACTKGPV